MVTLLSGLVKNFSAGKTLSTSIRHSVMSKVDSSISSSLLADMPCVVDSVITFILS